MSRTLAERITITCGRADRNGKCRVTAWLDGAPLHHDELSPYSAYHRGLFAAAVWEKATGTVPDETTDLRWIGDAIIAAAGAPIDAASQKSAVAVCLADVEAEPVDWLWPQRIARRKLILLAGIPGLGKSFLLLDCAARCSIGGKYPDCDEPAPCGSTIILSCEDGLADTIKPRLVAAGADCRKVVAMTAVKYRDSETGDESESPVDLTQHVEQLEQLVVNRGDVVLVGIDPLSGFLGATDCHRNEEVRRALARIIALAEKYNFALLGVTHLTKDEARAAINRAQGSIAFVAAARSVLAVVADKRDSSGQRRLLIPVKNNLGNDRIGLSYELTSRFTGGTPCVVWGAEPVDIRADDALAPEPKPKGRPAEERGDAEQFLRDALADGPRLARDVEDEATNAHCIARKTLERARKAIGVVAERPVNPGPWWWRLSEWADRQNDSCEPQTQELWRSGVVGNFSEKTADSDGQTATTPQSIASDNGHDPDAVNRLFAETVDGSDE